MITRVISAMACTKSALISTLLAEKKTSPATTLSMGAVTFAKVSRRATSA